MTTTKEQRIKLRALLLANTKEAREPNTKSAESLRETEIVNNIYNKLGGVSSPYELAMLRLMETITGYKLYDIYYKKVVTSPNAFLPKCVVVPTAHFNSHNYTLNVPVVTKGTTIAVTQSGPMGNSLGGYPSVACWRYATDEEVKSLTIEYLDKVVAEMDILFV